MPNVVVNRRPASSGVALAGGLPGAAITYDNFATYTNGQSVSGVNSGYNSTTAGQPAWDAAGWIIDAGSPIIKSRTIAGANQNAIQMTGGMGVRRQFGSSWNTIRIGFRWHLVDTGSALPTNNYAGFGMCSHGASAAGAGSNGIFINQGVAWQRGTNTYGIGGNPGVSAAWNVGKCENGTFTAEGYFGIAGYAVGKNAATATADRNFIMFEIVRGNSSSGWACYIFSLNADAVDDVDEATYITLMQTPRGSLSRTNYISAQSTVTSFGLNESAGVGPIDAIYFTSGGGPESVEFCSAGVYKFA